MKIFIIWWPQLLDEAKAVLILVIDILYVLLKRTATSRNVGGFSLFTLFYRILYVSMYFYVLLYRSILLYIARIIYLSMLFYAILWVSISFYVILLKISWQGYSYCYNVLVICCFLPLAHITNLINFSFHRRQKCWRFLFYIAPNLPDRPFVYRCCNISE